MPIARDFWRGQVGCLLAERQILTGKRVRVVTHAESVVDDRWFGERFGLEPTEADEASAQTVARATRHYRPHTR